MSKPLKILALTLLVCGSAACSNIGSKSPDEMVRHAMQHNLTRDNQYQFEGHVSFVNEAAPDLLQKAAAGDSASGTPAVEAAGALSDAEIDAAEARAGTEAYADSYRAREDRADGLVRHLLTNMQMRYSGAVDIPERKIEIIPELHYQNRQALVSVKLPMQMDLREFSILADPSAVSPLIDAFGLAPGEPPIGDKLVRLDFDKLIGKKLPTEALLQGFPKAIDDGLAGFDKAAFQRMEMDEAGRKAGARYRVRLQSNLTDNIKLSHTLLESLIAHLKQDGGGDEDKLPEGHQAAIGILSLGQIFYGEVLKLPTPGREDQANTLGLHTPVYTDYYLDGKGRFVAIRQTTNLTPLNTVVGSYMHTHQNLWMTIRYTRPQFTLKADPARTLDLNSTLFAGLDRASKDNTPGTEWDDLRDLGVDVRKQ
ncbi:hypothetical protein L1281_002199 [Neisseria sp. HSC-16F19]|nr:hypothetical protein [Neisseria sp. HSC-16F19]MCP2041590.1 hypothetical protein [Neisseria sp. HSC-16F19]